ncbi:MAG: hypothetical protein MUO53_04945 [Maribacter sp.]|nr:hypothetical protein [Maribacter sp.]
MNVKDFTYLLRHPEEVVRAEQTNELEDIIKEYPYFQAARVLHLKGLKNNNSFKYNKALKVTAAYTADREVLFDFITSDDFLKDANGETFLDTSISIPDREKFVKLVPEKIKEPPRLIEESEDRPLPQSTQDADQILDPQLFESKNLSPVATAPLAKNDGDPKLVIGEPLQFTKDEKYSFGEWLQLTSMKAIERNPEDRSDNRKNSPATAQNSIKNDTLKRKKFERIDKFLSENPKIDPDAKSTGAVNINESLTLDKNELMTETLAKVYLEQKKYKKAIQAYKILSLKYPEKSGFFADRIKAVEKIQKDNSEG